MNIVFGVIIGLLILMLLVIAHEFGHFIMARRSGVKVNEFGIGFPPRAIAWVKKEVEVNGQKKLKWVRIPKEDWDKKQDSLILSINWLPIGGFCSMEGESANDHRPGTFGASSFWSKTKILFGGVLMNWLVAFVLLTVLAFTGMPQMLKGQFYLKNDAHVTGSGVVVNEVIDGSPAADAGFQDGDRIISVGDELVMYPETVSDYGREHAGGEAEYVIDRNGEEHRLTARLNPADSEYTLGVKMSFGQTFVRSTWSAPLVGAATTVQLTGETFKSLGQLVWNLVSGVARQFSFDDSVRESGKADIGAAGDSVSGPVGIIGVIFPAFAQTGLTNLTFLAALISVSLACMNVLPIPALDGGRWLLIAIYKLRGKKLTKDKEERIVSRAFMVLLALIALVTVLDIIKLF